MSDSKLVIKKKVPIIQHGFPVGQSNKRPAIGEQGISPQIFCPLIQDDCKGPRCMFWVELATSDQPDARRVAHCAYYWNTLQLVEIKQQLMKMATKLEIKESRV